MFPMALLDLARPRATYCGIVWHFMVLHDFVAYRRYCLAFLMVLYGLLWQNIDLI